jgi:hypothetical protein
MPHSSSAPRRERQLGLQTLLDRPRGVVGHEVVELEIAGAVEPGAQQLGS